MCASFEVPRHDSVFVLHFDVVQSASTVVDVCVSKV